MKKILICLICAGLVLTAAACSRNDQQNTGSQPASESEIAQPQEPAEPDDDEELEETTAPEDTLTVPGAAMYRGVIKEMTEGDGGLRLVLEQVEGTEFGMARITILIDEDSRLSFDREQLEEGRYLEIYYGVPMGGDVPEEVDVIAANLLPDAELSVHNGFVVEMSQPDDEGTGTILLADQNGEHQVLFHYYDSTQKYLDFESLQEGAHLNIYTDGATTRSIPPQANALEIRPYK